jgi:hypothetical protein
LVDQIVGAYFERPLNPMQRTNTLGASIADALVAKMLTEETLTKILHDGLVTEGLPDAQMPALATGCFKHVRNY